MEKDASNPQINVSKIPGGGGIAGAIFAISSMLIFLAGIPVLRYFLPAAALVGFGIYLMIKLVRRIIPPETPGTPWILTATETEHPSSPTPTRLPDAAELTALPA